MHKQKAQPLLPNKFWEDKIEIEKNAAVWVFYIGFRE